MKNRAVFGRWRWGRSTKKTSNYYFTYNIKAEEEKEEDINIKKDSRPVVLKKNSNLKKKKRKIISNQNPNDIKSDKRKEKKKLCNQISYPVGADDCAVSITGGRSLCTTTPAVISSSYPFLSVVVEEGCL